MNIIYHTPGSFAKLYRVHESLFDSVEEKNSAQCDKERDSPGEGDVVCRHHACAEEHVSKGFDDNCHRIAEIGGFEAGWHHVDGIDDGRRVHPELHAEADQVVQVAVFSGQR